jgi:stalled ribosome rescue protein Dom34
VKRQTGLWINHRKTIIVSATDHGEETRIITSNLEQQGALSGTAEISAEDLRDKRIKDHLGRYYDQVVDCIRDADSILIFGPGEAKGDLRKRLETAQLNDHIVGVESVDWMTVHQLRTRVRERFPR